MFFVALGFHSSALLLGAAVFAVQFAAKKDIANIKKAIIVSAVVLVLLFGQNLFILLVNIGVLSHRYYLYINTFIYGNSLGRSEWISVGLGGVFEVLIRVFILISALLFVSPKARNKEYKLYCLMYLIGIVIYSAGLMIYHTSYFVRLSLCFDMFGLLLISKIDQYSILSINSNGKRIHFMSIYTSLLYWFIHILVLGQSGSIPYIFG